MTTTTTLTLAASEGANCLVNGSKRSAPEPQPSAQRFAELLQHRRDAQPAPSERQSESQSASKPVATRESGPRDCGEGRRDGGDSALQASSGCGAAQSAPPAKSANSAGEASRDRAANDPPQEAAAGATGPNATDGAGDVQAASDADRARDRHAAADDDAATRPDLTAWPGMAAGASTAASDAPAGSGARKAADLRGGGTDRLLSAAALDTGDAVAGASASKSGGTGGRGADGGAPSDDAAALFAANASKAAFAAAADRFALPPHAAETALAGAAGVHAAQRFDAGIAVLVALPTPVDAPDFARALGAQVSVFARNGLAHAELQLTPAEMGPIRVQIAIDGAHARVDFAADSAATRQAIERGLPELASALREQGLTLAGGGVFQRAPDQSKDSDAPQTERIAGRGRRRSAEAIVEPVRVRSVAVRPGGVDLYA